VSFIALVFFVLSGGVFFGVKFFGNVWAKALCGIVAFSLTSYSIYTMLFPGQPAPVVLRGAEAVLSQPGKLDWQSEVSRASAGFIDRVYNTILQASECRYDVSNPPFAYASVELDGNSQTKEIFWMWAFAPPCEGYSPTYFCGPSMCQTHVFRIHEQGVEELLLIMANQIEVGRGESSGFKDVVIGGNRVMKFNGTEYSF